MTKGFIIAVPQKYEHICYQNVLNIRYKFNIDLPIELWQIGNEISNKYIELFKRINNVIFKNVIQYTNNTAHWKGFQVKAFILKYTTLEEPILCDADIVFHSNPLEIYNDSNYIETGTYFFRDLKCWEFSNLHKSNDKFHSIDFYNMRKKFILSLLPNKSEYFPKEWDYIYESEYPKEPVQEAFQESGVVYINKNKLSSVIDRIFYLNNNHKFVYRFIWGDKETFWLSCLIENCKFYINDTYGYMLNKKLTHNYNDKILFTQK
jgi:hypothetical protein